MKILLHTRCFPSSGGIETLFELLAREWVATGQDVAIVTDVSAGSIARMFPFPVQHRPGWTRLVRMAKASDILVQMNVSLKLLSPSILGKVPLVFVHNGCYFVNRARHRDLRERLKLFVARRWGTNIAVSRYVADAIRIKCAVIPNAYDLLLFHEDNDPSEKSGIAFVGRLVCDKGASLLLDAIATLRLQIAPRLTIIGDGPERPRLERKAQDLGILDQVSFLGNCSQPAVATVLKKHRVLVVPSISEEPFGIVALEGIASGCRVLASDGGGLPEAVGNAGLTFRSGDSGDLASKLAFCLSQPVEAQKRRAIATAHLARHQPARVAAQYLDVFRTALRNAH